MFFEFPSAFHPAQAPKPSSGRDAPLPTDRLTIRGSEPVSTVAQSLLTYKVQQRFNITVAFTTKLIYNKPGAKVAGPSTQGDSTNGSPTRTVRVAGLNAVGLRMCGLKITGDRVRGERTAVKMI